VDLPAWIHKYVHVCGENAHKAFRSLVDRIERQQRPSRLIVAADCKGNTVRHDLYPDYKSNRKRTAEEQKVISEQLELAKCEMREINVQVIEKDGFEAEDLIASRIAAGGWNSVVIVGSDKDLKQLIRPSIVMWDTKFVTGPAEVYKTMGVHPWQVRDYLSMVGDTTDNIPGVAGIGATGAVKILSEHKSLGRAVHAAFSTPLLWYDTRYAKLLREGVDSARLSKALVELRYDAIVPDASCGELTSA